GLFEVHATRRPTSRRRVTLVPTGCKSSVQCLVRRTKSTNRMNQHHRSSPATHAHGNPEEPPRHAAPLPATRLVVLLTLRAASCHWPISPISHSYRLSRYEATL